MGRNVRKTLRDAERYVLLLSFGQLQEILLNLERTLERAMPSPATRDLELRAMQVRAAINAFRNAGVSEQLRRALTGKVIDLEQEALEIVHTERSRRGNP
jgi:hypothetical protein